MDTIQKLYLDVNHASNGLRRVEHALVRHKPGWVQITHDIEEADVVILHVVGRQDQTTAQIQKLKGKKYAMIQYALESTMRPKVDGWLPLWEEASLVWSYYDLPQKCYEQGKRVQFRFYHSPLGANHIGKYNVSGNNDVYTIATSGLDYLTESVRECIRATDRVGGKVFHLGAMLNRDQDFVECAKGISDEKLAEYYSHCQFVSGLRRDEGFEFPAAEGLLCGARPILFDRPHYRQWYYDLGVFIPEEPRDKVIESLHKVFLMGTDPVSVVEIAEARRRFDWNIIIKKFYERLAWGL